MLRHRVRCAAVLAAGLFPLSSVFLAAARLKHVPTAFVTAAIVLLLSALPSYAQLGPFANFSGSWAGDGSITLSSGSREHIKCRATYDAQAGGNDLRIALRCAGDSYNYDFHGNANYSDGKITGSWSEASQKISGRFTGVVNGNQVATRIDVPASTVFLNMTTQGNKQSVFIRSQGGETFNVTISLNRR
jgi:hypothetical protein